LLGLEPADSFERLLILIYLKVAFGVFWVRILVVPQFTLRFLSSGELYNPLSSLCQCHVLVSSLLDSV
jgi:hypothetical protein